MNRIFSIDLLRGLVMLLMTIDHTRDMFSTVDIGEHLGTSLPWAYYFTRWITHFCAPTFVFLSGLSIALWIKKYDLPLGQAQMHIIKRGLFIAFLDITLASLLWTMIGSKPVFTVYLSELWAIGWGMVLLSLLLKLSARSIFLIGLITISTHGIFQTFSESNLFLMLLNGNGRFDLITGVCHVVANYPVLPWFGITCVGYAAGYYLINTTHTIQQQTRVFLLCAVISIALFVLLRTFNLYGDSQLFVSQSNAWLMTFYSFMDVTKYPPSLLYTLVTLLLGLITLAFRQHLENHSSNSLLRVIKHYGEAPLFYYLLHLSLIYFFFVLFTLWKPESSIKTDNLFVVYLITVLVALTAYPILHLFKRIRNKYKTSYPILGYV